jgi:hypothetical protein
MLWLQKASSIRTEEEVEWAPQQVWRFWRRDKLLCCVQNVVTISGDIQPIA